MGNLTEIVQALVDEDFLLDSKLVPLSSKINVHSILKFWMEGELEEFQ